MSKAQARWGCMALALLTFAVARGDDGQTLMMQGAQAYYAGDYAKAAEKLDAAAEAGTNGASVRYSAACAHAQLGHTDVAFKRIEQSARCRLARRRDVARPGGFQVAAQRPALGCRAETLPGALGRVHQIAQSAGVARGAAQTHAGGSARAQWRSSPGVLTPAQAAGVA